MVQRVERLLGINIPIQGVYSILQFDTGLAKARHVFTKHGSMLRPVFDNGYERTFSYVYGAVSPMQAELDWKICSEMKIGQMNHVLQQVNQAHLNHSIVMVVDGARSQRSKELRIPENIRFHRLPGYSPAHGGRSQCTQKLDRFALDH